MKHIFTKDHILHILLGIWVIFSVVYIAHDFWEKSVNKQVNKAYQAGLVDSVKTLIRESEKCKPIPVFEGEKQVELISIKCLQDVVNSQNTNEGKEVAQ